MIPRARVAALAQRVRVASWARTIALLSPLFVPWIVLPTSAGPSLVFPWGLATVTPVHVTTLPAYLLVHTAGLPRHLQAWPIGVGLYAGALASAATAAAGREDRRVTAGLLAVAGVSNLVVAAGLARAGGTTLPVGTALLWALSWWHAGRRTD